MGDVIATVTFIQGEVIARAPDGSERVLQIGDEIREGEVVITSAGGRVEFDFVDGAFYVMGEEEELTMSLELARDSAPAADEAVTDDDVVAEVLEALEGDEDLLDVLEDPAAGPGAGGDAGGGRSFVQLARISETTGDLAFNFGENPLDVTLPSEELFTEVAEDESTPSTEPEPPVETPASGSISVLFDVGFATSVDFVNGPALQAFAVEGGEREVGGDVRLAPRHPESTGLEGSITGTTENVPAGNEVTIVITDSDGNTLEVDGPVTVQDDGSYAVDGIDLSSLVNGELTVDVSVADQNGDPQANTTGGEIFDAPMADITFNVTASDFVDGEGSPDILLNGIVGTESTLAQTITVTISGPEGFEESFDVIADANGFWEASEDDLNALDLDDGVEYTASVTFDDGRGTDSASDSSGFDLPTVDVTFELGSEGDEITAEINGTSSNATSIEVVVSGAGVDDATFTVTPDDEGNWSVSDEDLAGLAFEDGEAYEVTATASDGNDNTASATATGAFDLPTVEIEAFAVEAENIADGENGQTNLTANGTTTNAAGVTVNVMAGGDVVLSNVEVTFDTDTGDWSVDLSETDPRLDADTEYTLDVVASDDEGNTASATETASFGLPEVAIEYSEGDSLTVDESLLDTGTKTGDGSLTDTGKFVISSAGGLAALTIAGQTFSLEDLNSDDLIDLENNPIDTGKGELKLTGFTTNADGDYELSFEYTLTDPLEHEDGATEGDKDPITVSVEDPNGNISSNQVNVTIIDDAPFEDIRDVTFENSGDAVFEGTAVNMGADQSGAALIWTKVPEGLTFGGQPIEYEGLGTSTLTAFVGEGDDRVDVFELVGNPDGTYTFNQFEKIDLLLVIERGLDQDDFDDASGPQDFFYVLENGDFATSLEGGDWAVRMSGVGGQGGNKDQLNSNANGFGVGQPSLANGEQVIFEFDNSGISGEPDLFSSAEVIFENNVSMDFMVTYSDGTSESGSFSGVDSYIFEAPDGVFLSEVTITNTGSSTAITGLGTTKTVEATEEGLPFEIGFDAIDGDGDSESGTIGFFAEPGETLDTSGSNEGSILVGSSSGNLLIGGEGDDIFYGGGGDDTFTGGGGNDLYIWQSGDEGSDIITDFGMAADEANADTLDVSDLLTGWDGEESLTSYIEAEEIDGNTVIKISSSGNLETGADQEITLEGVTGYSADSDIIQAMIEAGQLKVESDSNG